MDALLAELTGIAGAEHVLTDPDLVAGYVPTGPAGSAASVPTTPATTFQLLVGSEGTLGIGRGDPGDACG